MIDFHIMRPEWLWSIVPAFILAFVLWRQRSRSGSWGNVIDPALLQHLVNDSSTTGQRNPLPWILVAWCLAAFAASGPSWEKLPQPVHRKQDALVVILDLSYSMKSGDLAPSRADRARQKILDLLEQRREGQTALIAYAGDAHIVTPLTDDTPTIANLLPALHPDMMPMKGSDPTAAVEQAIELMHSAGIRRGQLLLVTDGIEEDELDAIIETLSGSGATLSVIGVGTRTGAPLPLPRGGFVKDADGAIVMAPLKDAPLRSLARRAGGQYRGIAIDEADLNAVLAEPVIPSAAENALALDRGADQWDDKGYLLLLPLIPFVLVLFRRGWILSLLPLLLIASPEPAHAQSWNDLWLTQDQQGQRALESGDAVSAEALFNSPDWAGTAAYEAGEFERAAEHFASGDSGDDWYNRGNALARAGKLDDALNAYEESLKRNPDQVEARDNLELVKKLLEQQQEQQSNEGDQGEDSEQEQDGEQNQDSQDQNSEGENDSNQQPQHKNDDPGQNENQSGANSSEQDPSQQNSSEPGSDEEKQSQGQSGEEPTDDQAEDQTRGAGKEQEREDTPQDDQKTTGAGATSDADQSEQDQAMEQWLRRVPDDPSGLLRQKFRYESELRKQQGKGKNNEKFW